MQVSITRKELYAIVVLTDDDGRTCTTTLEADVQADDKRITKLVNRYNHLLAEIEKCSARTVKKSLKK